jgi:[pyruvate, water dikinase]-phosphate phosphotransferase / [pyruvate, water dikinase] kinase
MKRRGPMGADDRPYVYILSDSLGETADAVAKAALSQFPEDAFHVVRLPKIALRGQLQGVVHAARDVRCVILYTLAAPRLRAEMDRLRVDAGVVAVDILGEPVGALHDASGMEPAWGVGLTRLTDRGYFERVEALDFAVKHDDGRATDELDAAEMVLVGVSRSSKTPLAMYLAFKGYKVANVPLVPEVEPPPELFDVDPRRVFGLVTSPDLLVEVRTQRMADAAPFAPRYFDRESIEQELIEARSLMRRIGCVVVSTEAKAIEETAQEVVRHYEVAFGAVVPGEIPSGAEPAPAGVYPRRAKRPLAHPGD